MSIITKALKKAQETRPVPPRREEPPLHGRSSIKTPLFSASPDKKPSRPDSRGKAGIRIFSGILVTTVFFTALAGFFYYRIHLPASVAPPKPAQDQKNAEEPASKEQTFSDRALTQRKEGTSSAGNGASVKEQKELPSLDGIMYTPSYPQAVINGNAAREGDVISGFTVRKISYNTVILSSGADEFELKFR
ncbi:MAG: hypothetical protein ABIA77_05515 [Candidatus Omnitrophota bacterium]